MNLTKLKPTLTYSIFALIVFINMILAYLFYSKYQELPNEEVKFEKPIQYIEYIEYNNVDSSAKKDEEYTTHATRYKDKLNEKKSNVYKTIHKIPLNKYSPLNFNLQPNKFTQKLDNFLVISNQKVNYVYLGMNKK